MPSLLCFVCFTFAAFSDAPPTSKPVVSPDGLFEVQSAPKNVDTKINNTTFYTGAKLFLRLHGADKSTVLLRENDSWLKAQWAPRSHLLAVEDHWDESSSGVYVYAISLAARTHQPQYKLVFQSPGNVHDVQWSLEKWGAHRTIMLRCDVQRSRTDTSGNPVITQNDGAYTVHRTYTIGTRAISEKE